MNIKFNFGNVLLSVLSIIFLGQDSTAYFVDPGSVLVERFEGWGSSLAWFGDVLGGMPQDVQDEITAAFFSVLQILLTYKYNII